MADNFVANPGTGGDTFAADDVGGVKVPYSKLDVGADGVSSPVTAANPLPVTIGDVVHQTDQPFTTGDFGVLALAKRRDSDTTSVSNDGDYTTLNMDEFGRLKVAAAPAGQAATTGNITGSAQTVVADVSRTSNITIYCTGTFAGANCTFEGSVDGTNYFGVQAVRTNANTIELTTGVLAAAPAYAWELSVNGLTNFRVRSTAFTSGTQVWRFQPAPYATEPIPAAQVTATQPISGTVTATVATTTNIPSTAQGASTTHHAISAASPNATSVKAGAGVINNITLSNNTASAKFFKLFNLATAPTVGSSTPVATVMIPANDTISVGCGPFGIRLATGIAYSLTGLMPIADATALALNDVSVFINYA